MRQHLVTIVTPSGHVSTVALNPMRHGEGEGESGILPYLPEDYIGHAVKAHRRATGLAPPLTIHYSVRD